MQEVTVHGAGIFGLSIAWACMARGAKVQIIDPNGPLAGASGGLVGALAPHVPENWNDKKQFQFESLLMAADFWREVENVSGLPSGYARSGRIQPLATDRQLELARVRMESAAALWQGRAEWRVVGENPAPGWAPDSATGAWVVDTLTARMHPRMAGASLLAALGARGVTVQAEAAPRGAQVWATGAAGLAELSTTLGRAVGGAVKGQSASFACVMADKPQVYAEALHVIGHADGTVAIGSTSERDFDDPTSTDEQLDALIAKARALVPALRDAPILTRWAGLRPRARSRAPMLGPWPGRPGHFIANGGFKIGFGMAPKVAEVMADLVLEGRDRVPEGFRVEASL
ncbi:MAG TPA: FAD-binding oxidoreductase [Aliiroseovarius sp.]|nr:FAD-binding oxidoreductase [Aliiroseovarius sp.]